MIFHDFFEFLLEKSLLSNYFIWTPSKRRSPPIRARMAESADATDLKSVAHKAYGFKSRSGYHFSSQLTVPGKKTALFTMGAGCLHCVQALRRRRSRSSPGSQPPPPLFRPVCPLKKLLLSPTYFKRCCVAPLPQRRGIELQWGIGLFLLSFNSGKGASVN